MTSSHEGLGAILPEEAMATAVAIADRSAQFGEINERIAAQLQGVPYVEKPPEVRRSEHLGRSALLLLQIEDPSRLLTAQEMLAAAKTDEDYKQQAQDVSATSELPLEAAEIKAVESLFITLVQTDSGMSDEHITREFARQLAASKEVAAEHEVDLATVYSDDSLYFEAIRRVDTPQAAAAEYHSVINSISDDMLNKIALQMMDTMLPSGIRDSISPDELNEMVLEFQLDPEVQTAIASYAGVMQETIRQTLLYSFIRAYGYDAINQLSEEHRQSLLPTMPLAEEVAALIRSDSTE